MEQHYDGCGQFITLKSIDARVTPAIRRDHRVSFTFTFEAVSRNFLLEESNLLPVPIGEDYETDALAAVATVSTDSDAPDTEARGTLGRVLESHWNLSDENREWLLDRALSEAVDVLRVQKVHACVSLEFGLVLQENHYYRVEDLDRLMFPEEDPSAGPLVPAVDSSIGSLKEYEIGSGSAVMESSCSICLDEFSGRDEEFSGRKRLLCMPCDHVFHGECIDKWLRISHCCPLCRYEMPTN